jgi:choline kinase
MKILILAAGRGTRISRYLSGNPKCTVDIGGTPLIEYTINMLLKKGISDIAIVLGYKGDSIKEVLKDYPMVRFYENPFYDVTNSIASAWFARTFLEKYDDTLIMNGDVFLEEDLFDEILAETKSPVMFADGSRKETADYKFYYEDGQLLKFGKELSGADISGEYIGIGKFSKEFMPDFLDEMNEMIYRQEHGVWWENIVYNMVSSRKIYVTEIDDKFWAEVDYIEDYERILKFRGYEADFHIRVHK